MRSFRTRRRGCALCVTVLPFADHAAMLLARRRGWRKMFLCSHTLTSCVLGHTQEIYDSYGDAGLKGGVPAGPDGRTYQYAPSNAEDIFEQVRVQLLSTISDCLMRPLASASMLHNLRCCQKKRNLGLEGDPEPCRRQPHRLLRAATDIKPSPLCESRSSLGALAWGRTSRRCSAGAGARRACSTKRARGDHRAFRAPRGRARQRSAILSGLPLGGTRRGWGCTWAAAVAGEGKSPKRSKCLSGAPASARKLDSPSRVLQRSRIHVLGYKLHAVDAGPAGRSSSQNASAWQDPSLVSPVVLARRVTLEELYNGCTKMRKLTRKVRCAAIG